MLFVCCELFADFIIGLCVNGLISCVCFSNNHIENGAITLAMLILSAPSDSLYILVYFECF